MKMKKTLEKLIEDEIRIMKGQQPVSVNIKDLVMMQMIGDFDSFLSNFTYENIQQGSFENIKKRIEETRKDATTEKLYEALIEKIIKSQFGDKAVALRELCQNAIDSYAPGDIDRKILFSLKESKYYNILKVRDNGIGMDLKDMVKFLLIPYNCSKEGDPEKIGEHGIGWFSVINTADLVKVVSNKRNTKKYAKTLVYDDGGAWKSLLFENYEDGIQGNGTEVTAYIPKTEDKNETGFNVDKESILEYLHKFIGYVDPDSAEISFDDRVINTLSDSYPGGSRLSFNIEIDKKRSPLVFSFSKRELRGEFSDVRFKDRNKNLSQVVYTQSGLFIKYGPNPFHESTIHYHFFDNLIKIGIDFWVQTPRSAGLTKGRTDFTADHYNHILDSMYPAFQNLFLDSIVGDEEVLYHKSGVLLEGLADAFNSRYKEYTRSKLKGEYSGKIRFLSAITPILKKSFTLGSKVAKFPFVAASKLIYFMALIPYSVGAGVTKATIKTCRNLANKTSKPAKQNESLEKIVSFIENKVPKLIGSSVLICLGAYGCYVGYKHFPKEYFKKFSSGAEQVINIESELGGIEENINGIDILRDREIEGAELVKSENEAGHSADFIYPVEKEEGTSRSSYPVVVKNDGDQYFADGVTKKPRELQVDSVSHGKEPGLEKIVESDEVVKKEPQKSEFKLVQADDSSADPQEEKETTKISGEPENLLEKVETSVDEREAINGSKKGEPATAARLEKRIESKEKQLSDEEKKVIGIENELIKEKEFSISESYKQTKYQISKLFGVAKSEYDNFSDKYGKQSAQVAFGLIGLFGIYAGYKVVKRVTPKKAGLYLGKVALFPSYIPLLLGKLGMMIVDESVIYCKKGLGLYDRDIEAEKAKKIENRRNKIIAKYRSEFEKESFLNGLFVKKMIRAVHYYPARGGSR